MEERFSLGVELPGGFQRGDFQAGGGMSKLGVELPRRVQRGDFQAEVGIPA